MSNFRKTAVFALALVTPIVAVAQTSQQANPAPQAASQAPAANSSAAAPAQPAPSPASRRFVTTENFYRPGAKPSQPATPATSAPAPAATPSTATPTVTHVAQPFTVVRPAIPVPASVTPAPAPVNVSIPEVRASQPAALITSPSTASGAVANAAVDYASGQLSVVADNAPLGFVLKMIASKTGAVIDLAPELQNEPVVAHLGPSPVREVLTALLDSPRIDYIVLGGSDENDRLQRVVVRSRHTMGSFAVASPRPQPRKPQDTDEEERLDQDGHLISGRSTDDSQKQRMENWQKTREAMRVAEIKRQAQERENERNGSPDPPAPPQDNQPPDPAQNPPQEPPQR